MKKKIANIIQLVLLIGLPILYLVPTLTVSPNNGTNTLIKTSPLILSWSDADALFVSAVGIYILCVVMCVVSILSKSIYKDGKAHSFVALLLVFLWFNEVFDCLPDGFKMIENDGFFSWMYIIWLSAILIVGFAKRSSMIAESPHKNEKNPIVIKPSSADELKKYKDLLDMGAITQEEFDAKKKELLGL